MHRLTAIARSILDRMEPERRYETLELRAFAPDASAEALREFMHELWVNREVERVGDSAWQRHRSVPPHQTAGASRGTGQGKLVKPEDLFDHDAFADFFK